MAFVRVEQRNARLATAVRVEFVKGRDGEVAKGTVTIVSNTRRGSGDDKSEEATAIQWTLWGKQAENASARKGPHVVSRRFLSKVSRSLSTKQSLHFVSSQPTSSSAQ